MKQSELDEILDSHKKWLNKGAKGKRANLTGFDLKGLNFRNANLNYVILNDADLRNTNLTQASLASADLRGVDLRRAHLIRTNFTGADLRGADLRYTILRSANLFSANLHDSKLNDADFARANTHGIRGITILSVDNIGTHNGKATFIPKYNIVFAGCWKGSLEQFLEQGLAQNKYSEKKQKQIQLAYDFFKTEV